MTYFYYDVAGRILFTYKGTEIDLQTSTLPYVAGDTTSNHNSVYVSAGALLDRPLNATAINKTMMLADGVDSIVLSNVPKSKFTATNLKTFETITGAIEGTDSFSTTIRGVYKIRLESFPYLDFEATIEAI